MKTTPTKAPQVFAAVESLNYALSPQKLFTYLVPEDEIARVGDVFQAPFGPKNTLAVIRKLQTTKPKFAARIKPLGKKIPLSTPLPSYFLELADWLEQYYWCSARAVWRALLPNNIHTKARTIHSNPVKQNKKAALNPLNPDQKQALKQIFTSQTTLLHGITGSGKTEVYLQAIAKVSAQNKSTILLVPEIMLTSQLQNRVTAHFSNVIVLHSGLTAAVRKRLWIEALHRSQNEPVVVIGPRSALFTPLHNLGLIIIDEEHEPSYKQESAPRYEAQMVAGRLAQLTKARLVLGSATPSLRSYQLAQTGRIGYAILPARHNSVLPSTEIVDMKAEEDSLFSERLQSSIESALKDKHQVLLFLNRRGSARALVCNSCGQAVLCPRCDISLTFHADIGKLACHYCNFRAAPAAICVSCSSSDMRFVGDGTKKLESEIKSRWPEAKVARIDSDNAELAHLQSTYEDLASGEIDIILGTQMISRGLDIAGLTLVGIIDADSAMYIPDFSSSERTFQLLSQSAGRAGRRDTIGQVIIQTRNPQAMPIIAAANHDYESFYASEMSSRKTFVYPPFCYLVKLEYAHSNPLKALEAAEQLKSEIIQSASLRILGPVSRQRRTLSRKTVITLIIKTKSRAIALNTVKNLPTGWVADLDPIGSL